MLGRRLRDAVVTAIEEALDLDALERLAGTGRRSRSVSARCATGSPSRLRSDF
jgi:hypothetical protein